MSLGVLNNLSAMYAENSLNNTTNSLNTEQRETGTEQGTWFQENDLDGKSMCFGEMPMAMALFVAGEMRVLLGEENTTKMQSGRG